MIEKYKTREIVISKYKEDISWSKGLNDILIYNKNDQDYNKGYIDLPNIGREGHTFLTYIIDNYYNLKDITIFLQGNPFDHCPYFLEMIKHYKYGYQMISTNINYIQIKNNKYFLFGKELTKNPLHIKFLKEAYGNLFYKKDLKEINLTFAAGAQSIVPRKRILSNKLSFYIYLKDKLESSSNLIDPPEGYGLEELWFTIFNKELFL